MRKYRVGLIILLLICFGITGAYSQSCVSSNNNITINFSCGINCGNVNLQVPDLRTTSDYTVSSITYNPYPFVTTAPLLAVPCASQDDKFFDTTFLPFQFCFYDSLFTKCVLGTNGLISFDLSNILKGNNWDLDPPLPIPNTGTGNVGTGVCATPTGTLYPRAAIMGLYADIFPQASDPLYKIEARTEGTAPCRKFIVSFSQVPLYNCSNSRVTSQMVLHESTAIIEIFIEDKPFCSFNGNIGIIGIQDWTRTKGVAAPSRNAGSWTAQNEAYRFTPSGGASRFINSQLFTMSGSLASTATTSFATAGNIDLSFPNVCPSGNSEQFVVRTSYTSCADPNTILITEDTITINKTSSLGATATVADLNCTTGSTGTITVNVPPNSGVAPYQYSINGGPSQSSNIFSGLSVGNYTVFATDINGCSSTLNVTVNRVGILGIGYTSINAACAGLNTGSITILPPSLYTPIQYSLNGGAPQTSNIFAGLSAGTYTVSAIDAIGCSGSTIIIITEGAGILATFTTTPTSCSGANNGTIIVSASGGNLPYQYSLNGGSLQGSNVFSGLAAGTYSIRVVDVNGCNSTYSVTVNPGAALNATITKTNVSCNGAADGTISINISNGTAPYQYSLDNITWQTNNSFVGLTAGSYTVYYRDNNACSNSQPVIITQPAVFNETLTSQSPRCFGYNDGTITATLSGGTGPYQYSLNNITWQAMNVFSILTAGTYTVYCRDANGCTVSQTITLTQPILLTGTTVVADATCNGGADGMIMVNATGGIAPYGYTVTASPLQITNIFNVVPGTYNVTIADANACVINIPNVVVGLSNNLSVSASPDVTICEGKSTQLNVTSNATQFLWTQVASLSNANIQNPIASPIVTTQYIVTATYGQCTGKDTIVVNVNPAPIPDAGPDVEICYGQDYTLQGSGGVQFIWTPPLNLSNSALPNPLSNPQQTTIYNLNVIDANGCSSLAPDQVKVTVTPPIIVKTFPSDTVVFAGDQFQLLATSGATNYSWGPTIGLSNPFIANPMLTVSTDVTFNIIATTAAGCRGDGTMTVKVFKGPEIYMPTGFTPNGDGKNDKFKPFTVGITKLNYFRVYNRWGRLIFSTTTLNDGWDGRIGGIDQPTSTFVWMVQGVARDGKVITKKGTVTLVR